MRYSNALRIVKAGAAYFALVFTAGFIFGAIRVPFVVPRLGERTAELIEAPFMLVVIVIAARFITRRFALPAKPAVRLGTGLVGLAFLLAAEFLFAAILQNLSPREYITNRDPISGAAFAIMLALYALMPLMKR